MSRTLPWILTLTLAIGADAFAKPAVPEVAVLGPRVALRDVLPGAPVDVAGTDLGPAPPPNGTRLVTRLELEAALKGKKFDLPDGVRVVRKMRKLGAPELSKSLDLALVARPIGRGGKLKIARPPKQLDVAEGWDVVVVDVPRPPRKAGAHTTTALLQFRRGTELLGSVSIPIDIDLPKEALLPDVPLKSAITLLVKKGSVEVRTKATAGSDGDVGDTIPVLVSSNGKVVSAKLESAQLGVATGAL